MVQWMGNTINTGYIIHNMFFYSYAGVCLKTQVNGVDRVVVPGDWLPFWYNEKNELIPVDGWEHIQTLKSWHEKD